MAPMAPGVASTLMGPLLYNPPLEERERILFTKANILLTTTTTNTSLSKGTTNEVNMKTFFGASIIGLSMEHGIFSKK